MWDFHNFRNARFTSLKYVYYEFALCYFLFNFETRWSLYYFVIISLPYVNMHLMSKRDCHYTNLLLVCLMRCFIQVRNASFTTLVFLRRKFTFRNLKPQTGVHNDIWNLSFWNMYAYCPPHALYAEPRLFGKKPCRSTATSWSEMSELRICFSRNWSVRISLWFCINSITNQQS